MQPELDLKNSNETQSLDSDNNHMIDTEFNNLMLNSSKLDGDFGQNVI